MRRPLRRCGRNRSPGVTARVGDRSGLNGLMAGETRDNLLALAAHVEGGELTPVIGRSVDLDGAADALACLGEGHGYGKVVVRIGEPFPRA